MRVPRLVVAAPHRSSGKSSIAIGLAAALRGRGLAVQPFKKGPDFIDPMWLTAAAGRQCRTLDFFLQGAAGIASRFAAAAPGADLALVETNHGLHDGPDPGGADSGAALAHLLGAPVLLVVNTQRWGRGVAALVRGQAEFDPRARVAAVVLNRVRPGRHERKLREAVERGCELSVAGAVPDLPELGIKERHLGLTPLAEAPRLEPVIDALADAVARHLDLERIVQIARGAADAPVGVGAGEAPAGPVEACAPPSTPPGGAGRRVRIGVARDAAFIFYYPENLEALREAGADLVPFSPLEDPRLPPVDGLYVGGGFPELFLERLEGNRGMREGIRAAVAAGMPVWAECGGLMYLSRAITWRGRRAGMVGALPCEVAMEEHPAGHGYVELEATPALPWAWSGGLLRGHEFHHSRLVGVDPEARFAFRVRRGAGAAPGRDGIVAGNCVGAYTHLHADGAPAWGRDFVGFVRAAGGRPGRATS